MTTALRGERFGLSDLGLITLTDKQEALVAALVADSQGPAHWRRRKEHETRRLLALAQIAPRLTVQALDLRTTLKALLQLQTPVPCLPPGKLGGTKSTVTGSTYLQLSPCLV